MANKDEQIEELEKFKQIKYKKDDMVILIDENKKLRY